MTDLFKNGDENKKPDIYTSGFKKDPSSLMTPSQDDAAWVKKLIAASF